METFLTITFPVWLQLHLCGAGCWKVAIRLKDWLPREFIALGDRFITSEGAIIIMTACASLKYASPHKAAFRCERPSFLFHISLRLKSFSGAIIIFWWFSPRVIFHLLITICNGSCDRMRIYLCNFIALIHVLRLAYHFFCSCSNGSWYYSAGSCKEYE